MGGLSIWHLFAIVVVVLEIVPIVAILRRAGFSGWWAILMYVPLVNLIALWLFAFARWPNVDGRS